MGSISQADQILKLITKAGNNGVPNWRLSRISLQYNGRIFDLRHKRGLDIRQRRIFRKGKPSETHNYYLNQEAQ